MADTEPLLPDSYVGLTTASAESLLRKYGRNEFGEQSPACCDRLRCGVPTAASAALWIAVVVSFVLKNFAAATILLVLLVGTLGFYWVDSAREVAEASRRRAFRRPRATVERDGAWCEIDAALLVPGDKIRLSSGSAVPADCTVNADPTPGAATPQIDVDHCELTGESLPVTLYGGSGEFAFVGGFVVRGEADGTVQRTGGNAMWGRFSLLL